MVSERVPLVAVVGICAVGKTTVVTGLRDAGYSAIEIAQEHSEVPYLWARSDPSFVVCLDAEDDVVWGRREYLHPERLRQQRDLLSYAKDKSDLELDVSDMDSEEVISRVTEALEAAGISRVPARFRSIKPEWYVEGDR